MVDQGLLITEVVSIRMTGDANNGCGNYMNVKWRDLETALTGVVAAPGQLWSPPLAPTGRIPLPLASPLSTISCPPLGGAAVAAGAYAKPGDIAIDGRRRTVFVAFVHFREEDNSR
uniref:Uncharacterized protein n=1 Tax=Triticum urartu TaxID=4572 RepID=A0A8R7NZ25_TRIUA